MSAATSTDRVDRSVVAIAENVWETWRERTANDDTESIALLLTADAPSEMVMSVLRAAIDEAMKPREARMEGPGPIPLGEEFSAGRCLPARVPQGVLLLIDENPWDLEGLLGGLAEGLRARGIDGVFDVYEAEGVVALPEVVDFIECHLRVIGEPGSNWKGTRTWEPDPEALAAAAEAGIAWCQVNEPELPLTLAVGVLPPFLLRAADDVHGYLREAIEGNALFSGQVRLTSGGPERFRQFVVTAATGRVSLVEGGAVVQQDWRSTVERLTQRMRAAAPWVVYSFLKRGSWLVWVGSSSLRSDWIEIPHFNVGHDSWEALEDHVVPDAFGAQLLSTGHLEHIPGGPDWTVECLATGRVLVAHVDPTAWFDGSLVRFGSDGNRLDDPYPPTPHVVTKAREAFGPLLYRD